MVRSVGLGGNISPSVDFPKQGSKAYGRECLSDGVSEIKLQIFSVAYLWNPKTSPEDR